jgi:CO dehydrogenase/acetyl-CoA synthase delta subunit
MSTTFFIESTILSWKKTDLNIINSLNISYLNLGLNKNTINSPKYYCEGSRKLSILH